MNPVNSGQEVRDSTQLLGSWRQKAYRWNLSVPVLLCLYWLAKFYKSVMTRQIKFTKIRGYISKHVPLENNINHNYLVFVSLYKSSITINVSNRH